MSSPEYEDNVYESQENFFEENTNSDIDELNDLTHSFPMRTNGLIGNLHPNQVKATVIQIMY